MTKQKDDPTNKSDDEESDGKPEQNGPLEKLGFRNQDFSRIKLGSGIVGKLASMTTYVSLGLLALASAALVKGESIYAVAGFAGGAVLVYLYGVRQMEKTTNEHPDLALLEGSELVKFRQQEHEFEIMMKGIPKPIKADVIETDPSLPAIEPSKETKDEPDVIDVQSEARS